MKNLIFSVLGATLLVTACAAPAGTGHPNSASSMENGKQAQPKDPHDFLDPTAGSKPPQKMEEKPLCQRQCGPNLHCDASGPVERCVPNQAPQP